MDPQSAKQHADRWGRLARDLTATRRLVKDEWPIEWKVIKDDALLEAIFQSEAQLRNEVNAAIRWMAQRNPLPGLSMQEQWHLRVRLDLGVETCTAAMRGELHFPDLDSEVDRYEFLLIQSWEGWMCQRWQARMRLHLEEVQKSNKDSSAPTPPKAK